MTLIWSQMVYAIPALLVGIFALVLAIINWSRCPRAALLVAVGAGVLLAATVMNVAFYGVMAPGFHRTHSAASLGTLYAIAGFVSAILHQGGVVLLILAAFAGRKPAAPPPMR